MMNGFVKRWEEFPLRWKSIVLAVVPFVVLLLSASMALWGNRERERTEGALAHHIALANSLEDVQFLIVNAETGTRGYLLTRRSEFLEPFRRAQHQLPLQRKQLEQLVASEPGAEHRRQKTVRLKQIEAQIDTQMKNLAGLQGVKQFSPSALMPGLEKSKRDMDELRIRLLLMRRLEEGLLSERMSDIKHVRERDYLGIALTLIVGVLARAVWIYLFNTGINARLERVRANVKAREKGESLPHGATTSPDALGELEREIAALSLKSEALPP